MNRRSTAHLLMAASLVTSVAVHAAAPAPGTCPNDSKLLRGFVDENDQIDYLNDIFGTSFGTLDELKTYNLQLVAGTWDR